MKKVFIYILITSASMFNTLNCQLDYNEETIRQQLDKFIENPKLYFEKIRMLNDKAEQANKNTMKISDEYLSIMDKKDSVIKIYKSQVSKLKAAALAPTTAAAVTVAPSGTISGAPALAGGAPKPKPVSTISPQQAQAKANAPYRVQLAAFSRDEFKKFFGGFTKTMGVETLENRNVIEIQGFKDSLEAYEFSQKFRQLGFSGAFVSKYNNGVREEGFNYIKSAGLNVSNSSAVNYPGYVPQGYKELSGKAESPKATAPPATTPPVINTVASAAPKVQPQTTTNYVNPTPAPSQSYRMQSPGVSVPKQTPPPSKPQVNQNTRDQLDAAFDQLFKK